MRYKSCVKRWEVVGFGLKVAIQQIAALCLLACVCLIAEPAWAWPGEAEQPQTLYVCLEGCDYTSIQAAVDAAGQGDVIKVAAGRYTGVNQRAGLSQVVYLSRTVAIQGGYTTTNWTRAFPLTQTTRLDAENKGRVFYIAGSGLQTISPTLEGLHITGGNAYSLGGHASEWGNSADAGGGVYVATATLTLKDNQIVSNTCYGVGGGVYAFNAPVFIQNNRILSNTAHLGGGVYLKDSAAALSSNDIAANLSYYAGGGVYVDHSPARLAYNAVMANLADRGGGVYLKSSQALLESNVITANDVFCSTPRVCDFLGGSGGGVFMANSAASLARNTIAANTAGNGFFGGHGAGLYLLQSDAYLGYNVVRGNLARDGDYSHGFGGGLYLERSAPVLEATWVMTNAASRGGGLYGERSAPLIRNSVFAGNQTGGVWFESVSAHIAHTTFAGNGDYGLFAGRYSDGQTITHSTVILTNTIVVSHSLGVSLATGSALSMEATLWGAGVWANAADWGGDGRVVTGARNLWADPAFVAPQTGDYHIGLLSPARDAGVDAGLRQDIDGQPRPMGTGFDLGADEFTLTSVYLPLALCEASAR